MPPIDASIPLSVRTPQAPDMIGDAARAYTLKSAMLQSQQAEQSMQAQQLLSSVVRDPGSHMDDPALPGLKTLTPEAWQKLQSNPQAFAQAKKAEQQMFTDYSQREELKQKKQKAFMDAAGPLAVGLVQTQEQGRLDDAAMQPKVDEAVAALKARGLNAPPGLTMAQVKQFALQVPKYMEQQLRATQPSTPHERAMEGKPQSAEGKIKADLAAGVLTPEEGKKAMEKKDRITVNVGQADEKLGPEELNFMARQALRGDTSVFQNIGRGRQSAANIAGLRREIMKEARAQGIAPEQLAAVNAEFQGLKAGERTLGTRTANIEMAVTEAQKMAPLALSASEKVNRSQFPNLNSLLLAAEKGTGGEDVVRLGVATNSLINIYSRAISPTGVPTVSDKEHARELLASAWSKGQYKAGVDQLLLEMNAARQSPGMVRQSFREALTGQEGGAGGRPDTPQAGGKPKRPLSAFQGGGGG